MSSHAACCTHLTVPAPAVPSCLWPAGEVIKPDTFKCVHDEGMPFPGRPFQKGNLYIHFVVEFPDSIGEPQRALLRQALPMPAAANGAAAAAMDTDEIEDVHRFTTVADIEDELKSRAGVAKGAGDAYDSDGDDDMPRGQRVQCAQQ